MKKKYYITIIGLLLLIPIHTKAFTGTANVTCDKTILTSNDSTTCRITGSATADDVVSIKLEISTGSNLTVSDVVKNSSWTGDDGQANVDLYGFNAKGNFSIATFKITSGNIANTKTHVSINNISYGTLNNNVVSIPSKSQEITIRTASSTNTLSALQVDGKDILDSLSYTTTNTSANITASATDKTSKITGIGRINLDYGETTHNVVVTAENGSTKTYTIKITRPDNRSSDNNLKELSVNQGTLRFKENTTSYNVNVDTDITSIEIKGNPKDSKSKITGTGVKNLKLGNNRFNITVTAENGSTKTYTINVNRKDNRSDNNNLKSLTLSNGKIDFRSDKTDYELVVDYEIDKISFTAEAEDEKSQISGLEDKNLEVGNNYVIIRVTAENGSKKDYNLTIIRNIEVIETTRNKAKNIIIKSHHLDFDPNKTEYTLETRLHELEITVELDDETSKYEITGNEDIHDGSIVQITITDIDGNNNIYTITISNPNEGKEDEGFLNLLIFKLPKYILYIVIFISILILLVMLILVSKEKQNIKKMLHKHKHHEVDETPTYNNDGLMGEPTYETLEMAKIDLEDYLSEERKAKRKQGIKESSEQIKDMRTELAEKIAILEDVESNLDKMKKISKKNIKAAEDLENTAINIETILDDIPEEEIKPKQTRTSRRKAKEQVESLSNEPKDIDEILSKSEVEDKKETKKKSPSKEEPKKEETSTPKKKKSKNKKKKTNKTSTTKSKDELLDEILANNQKASK